MRSRITAVAASRIPITSLARPAQFALALGAVATSACSPAAAKTTSDADTTAVPIVAHPVSLSSRAWSTTASGIVHANTTVDVAFQVPGKVVTVGPDEGQSVRAGQIIASVDPTEYRLAVDQAAAQADRAAHDRDRNQPLLASGGIAPADMDHLESGARQSAAAADLAKKRLDRHAPRRSHRRNRRASSNRSRRDRRAGPSSLHDRGARSRARSRRRAGSRRRSRHRRRRGDGAHSGARYELCRTRLADWRRGGPGDAELHRRDLRAESRRGSCAPAWSPRRRSERASRRRR